MKKEDPERNIQKIMADHDRANLTAIVQAYDAGQINLEAKKYLDFMYTGSMERFRDVFHVLGNCFGAPKAAVMPYDYATGAVIEEPMRIADINPRHAYMVHHRLDADPMRNQFFSTVDGHNIQLSVSSIVSVIVGAQKSIDRSLEKITGKYYNDYVNEVATIAQRVIADHDREASARAIADKIRKKFSEKYITTASETVLSIIGRGHEKIAVELVRELDKIAKPYARLRDIWRVKCLFDLIPQVRIFLERIKEFAPGKIITLRDKFYDMANPRNYRDAKIILNIGHGDEVVPLEIICQVRTLFEFERKNHEDYERARKGSSSAKKAGIEKRMAEFMEDGIEQYNLMICNCLDDLFDRVGWNILYTHATGESLFEGFPKISKLYYPSSIIDKIMDKIENAVENEVFSVPNAPAKLTPVQEIEIFRWMAKFILVSAMPYTNGNWETPCPGIAGRFFNFVMKELHRYYKK